jgi:hypothetical protein
MQVQAEIFLDSTAKFDHTGAYGKSQRREWLGGLRGTRGAVRRFRANNDVEE